MRTPPTSEEIARLVCESVHVVPYDPAWSDLFAREKARLRSALSPDLILRVEHFGSTAVPGLAAKPVIDMLVEVRDLDLVEDLILPHLPPPDYQFLWRPLHNDDKPPFYAWFIKRDQGTGMRTHHIHMVEHDADHLWERLLFRDYLIDFPDVAEDYARLKIDLAERHPDDRVGYTAGKSDFVRQVTDEAKRHYRSGA